MINKVILIGNVGADPEVRYIKEDQPVAHISLATTERGFKRQDGSEVPERTDWHRLTVWGRTAKFCENYVRKGDQLYVEGRIRYSQYQDKNNETRYSTEIIVDDLRKLGRKSDTDGIVGQPNASQQIAPQPTAASVVAEQQMEYPSADQPVDDLPF
ncbi:MAG: single-stranded DNA-binding protein [Bacteroidales bacterium]|nr:single-stranded DNA-binding protein [Bacteroidales bacterium]